MTLLLWNRQLLHRHTEPLEVRAGQAEIDLCAVRADACDFVDAFGTDAPDPLADSQDGLCAFLGGHGPSLPLWGAA